jgi:predicted nucleotidyltransferase
MSGPGNSDAVVVPKSLAIIEVLYYNFCRDEKMAMIQNENVCKTFKEILIHSLGNSLKEIILYGSRARGDGSPDSDYDMLVIAEGDLSFLKPVVREAEWICMEKYNVLVSSIIYTPKIWAMAKVSPLGWNIRREGVKVA